MAARAAAAMEMAELVEEFLLRLPPDDPASLVRAALVCKLWRRILADRGFRRRFCELHRRPPMLGFFNGAHPRLTPTSSFRPRNADFQGRLAIDSRHGRVLLASSLLFFQNLRADLAIWDPISGDLLELPKLLALSPHPLDEAQYTWNAAVLCASNPSSACHSIECHGGHFLVVLMITSKHGVYVFVYSSQAGTWSEMPSAAKDPLEPKGLIPLERSTLARNALYSKHFTRLGSGILKYDLGMQEISWISLPFNCWANQFLLANTEYGGLGIAKMESSRLHLWSAETTGPGRHLGWAPSRVIELNMVLPANILPIRLVAILHGLGAFLVNTNDGIFSVDLQSNRARKVYGGSCGMNVVPYMSFFTPALDVSPTNTGEIPGASVPSA